MPQDDHDPASSATRVAEEQDSPPRWTSDPSRAGFAATFATALGLFVPFRRRLQAAASQHPRRARWDALGLGLPGALAAAVLTIALANPAIPVLAVGLVLAAIEILSGRMQWREVVRAVGPVVRISLFLVCVALGALARSWNGPAQLLGGAGPWSTTGIAL